MLDIDLRSILLLVGVMGLLMSVIIFFLRRSLPPTIEGLWQWAAAPAIILASMLLLALRNTIHDAFSLVCGNLLLIAGCLLFHVGFQRFFKIEAKGGLRLLLLGAALAGLVTTWYALIDPDYGTRLRAMAILMFGIFFSLALMVKRHGGRTFAGRFVTVVLFAQSLVIALRFAATFVWPSGTGLFEPYLHQTLYIASFAFTMLLLTVGTVLLASERMRTEFQESVAERRLAEESFRQSEARFRRMFENNASIMLLLEPDTGAIIDANAAAARFYGHCIERLRAMRIDEINMLTPAEVAAERARAARAERNHFIFPHRLAGGEVRTVEVRATPIETDGRVLLFSIIHDITERKRAEDALRESQSRLSAVFHGSPIGISTIRASDGVFTDINDAALRMLGYAREEVIAHTAMELKIFVDPTQREEGMRQLREHGKIEQFQIMYRRRTGETGVMDYSGRIVEVQGEHCVVGMWVDVTERKRQEAALRQLNEELEQRIQSRTHDLQAANRELESFSYSVSHDLRAPLRAIEGFSRLLEDDYAALLDERGKNYFDRIRGAATRMAALIDDLLKLSRISRQKMEREPVDLSALVREAAEELRGVEPGRAVDWAIMPQISTHGDRGLLRVAVQNLVDNAWKYSSKRERARIEFGIDDSRGTPVYFVRDNGAGFDMEYADKLFGAFQRLHSPGEFPGTGIGLATVKRIIHRHGGEVWAEGRAGAGATFYFTL